MVKALLITGNTYTARREIKSCGGKWYPDEQGWIVPMDRAEEAKRLLDGRGLEFSETEVETEALETPTGERLRAIRQAKLDRRAERKLARAARLERLSDEQAAKVKPYDDYAFWTQPILVGHHSEKSHRRLRERLDNAMSKSARLYREAQELRAEAAPMKARIAGDAERAREKKREANDAVITVGSRVFDWSGGEGTVEKVNRKTYRIKFDRGFTWTQDKSFVRPA